MCRFMYNWYIDLKDYKDYILELRGPNASSGLQLLTIN